jgi:hypothetical protein
LSDVNPVKNLKLDEWYKTLIPIGAVILILSIVFPVEGFSRKELLMLGGGLVLIGIGEWKNERFSTQFVDQTMFNPFMKITSKFRGNDRVGVLLEVLGILAVVISILDIFNFIAILE